MSDATFPAQTYSKYPDRYPVGAPVQAISAVGARVLCRHADGLRRWYIDCVNGMGSVILGHAHPAVCQAVGIQMGGGIAFPLGTALEGEVAERLLAMLRWKRAEMVRFGKNGADVTGAAVKLARAVTGRSMILKNAYHGHQPWSVNGPPMNAGLTRDELILCELVPLNHMAILGDAFARNPIAALVLEAVPSGDPVLPTPEYLAEARRLCDAYGALLILDEVVTGCRIALGGAAEAYGIEPDLACYGKALANGMPLSALVGPREIMQRLDRDVFFSLTHGGEAASLAAATVTLRLLVEEDVPARLADAGRAIAHALEGTPVQVVGYPARPFFRIEPAVRDVFLRALLDEDVLCQGYVNPSLATVEMASDLTERITRAAATLSVEASAA